MLIFNTIISVTIIIFVIYFSQYPVFHALYFMPHLAPTCDTKNKVRCFNIISFRSRGCLYWYMFTEIRV